MPEDTETKDFGAFYDQFLRRVYRYVRCRVADTQTAEDLTAVIFEKAFRGWRTLRRPGSAPAWLFRIARNTVASHHRSASHRLQIDPDDLDKWPTGPNPEHRFLQAERTVLVRRGIQELSGRERDIIALKFGGGLTNRAIGRVVGASPGNVAVILHRALRKVHRYVEEACAPTSPEGSSRDE
jgi:RNA polymerase sigma factor (sigma-70 family)